MPHHAITIANSFLDIAASSEEELTPMQIQKLVYFSHGWHLAFKQEPLSAEHAQAWRWGPVFPTLYHAAKKWGSGSIMDRIRVPEIDYSIRFLQRNKPGISSEDTFATELIKRVWKVYGHMTGVELSQLTHDPDGPWQKIRSASQGDHGVDIPDSMIRDYFALKLDANAT